MSIPAAVLFLILPAAHAGTLGPDAQTLEAIRGAAVANPDHFFDGLGGRVQTLAPVGYEALPALPRPTRSNDVRFDSRRVLPSVTLHSPKAAEETSSSSRSEKIAGGAVAAAGAASLAAGLIVGGSLLAPFAGLGVALMVVGLYFLLKKS